MLNAKFTCCKIALIALVLSLSALLGTAQADVGEPSGAATRATQGALQQLGVPSALLPDTKEQAHQAKISSSEGENSKPLPTVIEEDELASNIYIIDSLLSNAKNVIETTRRDVRRWDSNAQDIKASVATHIKNICALDAQYITYEEWNHLDMVSRSFLKSIGDQDKAMNERVQSLAALGKPIRAWSDVCRQTCEAAGDNQPFSTVEARQRFAFTYEALENNRQELQQLQISLLQLHDTLADTERDLTGTMREYNSWTGGQSKDSGIFSQRQLLWKVPWDNSWLEMRRELNKYRLSLHELYRRISGLGQQYYWVLWGMVVVFLLPGSAIYFGQRHLRQRQKGEYKEANIAVRLGSMAADSDSRGKGITNVLSSCARNLRDDVLLQSKLVSAWNSSDASDLDRQDIMEDWDDASLDMQNHLRQAQEALHQAQNYCRERAEYLSKSESVEPSTYISDSFGQIFDDSIEQIKSINQGIKALNEQIKRSSAQAKRTLAGFVDSAAAGLNDNVKKLYTGLTFAEMSAHERLAIEQDSAEILFEMQRSQERRHRRNTLLDCAGASVAYGEKYQLRHCLQIALWFVLVLLLMPGNGFNHLLYVVLNSGAVILANRLLRRAFYYIPSVRWILEALLWAVILEGAGELCAGVHIVWRYVVMGECLVMIWCLYRFVTASANKGYSLPYWVNAAAWMVLYLMFIAVVANILGYLNLVVLLCQSVISLVLAVQRIVLLYFIAIAIAFSCLCASPLVRTAFGRKRWRDFIDALAWSLRVVAIGWLASKALGFVGLWNSCCSWAERIWSFDINPGTSVLTVGHIATELMIVAFSCGVYKLLMCIHSDSSEAEGNPTRPRTWWLPILAVMVVVLGICVAWSGISEQMAWMSAVVAVAIFVFKDLAHDYISGCLLRYERRISPGMTVIMGEKIGILEQMDWRYSVVRLLNGQRSVMPNSELMSQKIFCIEKGPERRYRFEIDFAVLPTEVKSGSENQDNLGFARNVRSIVEACCQEVRKSVLEDKRFLGVKIADNSHGLYMTGIKEGYPRFVLFVWAYNVDYLALFNLKSQYLYELTHCFEMRGLKLAGAKVQLVDEQSCLSGDEAKRGEVN